MNSMKSLLSLAIAAAAVMVAGCASESGSKTPGGKTQKQQVVVKVVSCSDTSSVSSTCYVGSVEPSRQSSINASFSGTVEKVFVREGQKVRKGDLIARISSTSVRSSYEMASSTLERARDGYERAKVAHESGAVSDIKMVEVESQLRQAEASERAAKQSLEDLSLKAPYSGTIGSIHVHEGEQITVGSIITEVVDVSSVEIHISVPENEYQNVSVGQPARITVPAINSETFGTVAVKGVAASALSHSYDCTIQNIQNKIGLMPGMVCKVFLSRENASAIVIPASAISSDKQGRYVWAVRQDTVSKIYVTTGGYSGNGIAIESGLEPEDYVIIEGSRKVSTGMKVKIEF